jgi:hypothetical protein
MPVIGLFTCVGADNDEWQFTTPSWSGTGEEYTVIVCKRTGLVSCTCKDAVCRRKQDLITNNPKRLCKHAEGLLRWIDQLTGEQT